MTFLNGLLAFGAAAFTIPLIIHLLHRSRFQVIEWGAMHLLESAQNSNSRRIQWQQWLLLLLRCALPVLLAMAMARPLLQSWLSSGNSSPISMVIAIDDSTSMFAVEQVSENAPNPIEANKAPTDPSTRFAAACKAAIDTVRGLPAGSQTLLMLAGQTPTSFQSSDQAELVSQLKKWSERKVPAGSLEIDSTIRTGLEWLSNSPHPRRSLLLVSDFQKHEWDSFSVEQAKSLADLLEAQPVRVDISMLRIGGTDKNETSSTASHANTMVESIAVSPTLLSVDRDAVVTTNLVSTGAKPAGTLQVALLADNVEVDRQELTLAENASAVMRSRWRPKHAGDHVLQISILRNDTITADNTLAKAVTVMQPIPILLVDGDRRGEPMQSESDFLRLALSPFSLLQGETGDAFVTKTISIHELNAESLQNHRAVCLCNVAEVPEHQQTMLREYVQQGNGLIVFMGDRINLGQYQSWKAAKDNGLRVAQLQPRSKLTNNEATENTTPTPHIKTQSIDFAPIREMSPTSVAALSKAQIEYRLPLEISAEATDSQNSATVAMQFDDGQAWIINSKIGRGHALWIATSCDDDDSNLPSKPAFVPLMQKLVAYAANVEPPESTIAPGSPWHRSLSEQPESNPNANRAWTVTKPDGTISSASSLHQGSLDWADTRLLGAYTAKLVESADSPKDNAAVSKSVVVTQGPGQDRDESRLEYLDPKALKEKVAGWNPSLFESSPEQLQHTHAQWNGREIWTWMWTALVICFLAEMALVQRLVPRGKGPAVMAPIPAVHETRRGVAS